MKNCLVRYQHSPVNGRRTPSWPPSMKKNRPACSSALTLLALAALPGVALAGAEADPSGSPAPVARKRHGTEKQAENVQRYMARIFDAKKYEHSCNATTPAE